MKKKYRVKSQKDFQAVINNRQSSANSIYVVYWKKNDLNYPRFGISSSKKIGNAVQRNLVRRQIRAMIQRLLKQYSFEAVDFVIIVRKKYHENDFKTNELNLEKILLKIKEDLR